MKSKEEQIELIRSQLTSSFSPTKENSSGFSQMSPNVPLARKNSQPEVSLNPVSGQKVYRDIVEPHEIPLNPTVQNISKMSQMSPLGRLNVDSSTFSQIPFPPSSQKFSQKFETSDPMSIAGNLLTTSQMSHNMTSKPMSPSKMPKVLTSQNVSPAGQIGQDFNFSRPLPNEVVDLRSLVWNTVFLRWAPDVFKNLKFSKKCNHAYSEDVFGAENKKFPEKS